jgi:hypothetical protein
MEGARLFRVDDVAFMKKVMVAELDARVRVRGEGLQWVYVQIGDTLCFGRSCRRC